MLPTPYEMYAFISDVTLPRSLEEVIDSYAPDSKFISNFNGAEERRSFYQMSCEEAYEILSNIQKVCGGNLQKIEDDEEDLEEFEDTDDAIENKNPRKLNVTSRASRFRFDKLGIPIGSKLLFTEDESIVVDVASAHKVLYKGKQMYVSPLAEKLLQKTALQGTLYFKYLDPELNKWETLVERRERLEKSTSYS